MIAVIDYGASNLRSVCNALKKIGRAYKVATRPQELARAEKVILPGVGAAGSAMAELEKRGLADAIRRLKIPFLGICLGMQLLADFSEEGDVKCLSIIKGRVRRFPRGKLKVPQIGWNRINIEKPSPLFAGIPDGSRFYFVNSFYFEGTFRCATPTSSPRSSSSELAKTPYGFPFASVVQKNNFYAAQFHPEKSGEAGLQFLRNFCNL